MVNNVRMTRPTMPIVTPIDSKGLVRSLVPYFIHIEPIAQVAAGATAIVNYTQGPRDFILTHIGWSSEGVAWPSGAGMPFKINIQDIGASIFFAPFRFLLRAVTGNNPNTSDNPAFELPVQWRFQAQTTISVELENFGAIACTPYIVLCGYLE